MHDLIIKYRTTKINSAIVVYTVTISFARGRRVSMPYVPIV